MSGEQSAEQAYHISEAERLPSTQPGDPMTARLDITDNPGPCIALWGDWALGYAATGGAR